MRLRPFVLKLHRWVALATAPFLFLIILSGMVLAFKPILNSGSRGNVDVPTLIAAIGRADPRGAAGMLTVAPDGASFTLESRRAGASGTFAMASGEQTRKAGVDVFKLARELHVSLMLHARWLVTLVTLLTVLVIASGFAGRWTKFRHTLAGWHASLGWLAWPLAALTPVTGALMVLHLGMPGRAPGEGAHEAARVAIAEAVAIGSQQLDLRKLSQVKILRGGGAVLSVQDGLRPSQYLVRGDGSVTRSDGPGWVRMLHEGTWAGAWSGVFTLISTFPILGLLVTGCVKWLKRSPRPRPGAPAKPSRVSV